MTASDESSNGVAANPHSTDNAARQAALDAWQKWCERTGKLTDARETEGAALWRAAYDALDFSWDGLAHTDEDIEYVPQFNRITAGSLKAIKFPEGFPGEANLQDYWRVHRDF